MMCYFIFGIYFRGRDCRYRISLFNIVSDLSLKPTDDCTFCLSRQWDMSQAYWCPVIGKTFYGCLLKSNRRTTNYRSASARVTILLRTNAHHRRHFHSCARLAWKPSRVRGLGHFGSNRAVVARNNGEMSTWGGPVQAEMDTGVKR